MDKSKRQTNQTNTNLCVNKYEFIYLYLSKTHIILENIEQ